MDRDWNERFGGIDRLYGSGALARLRDARIAVVGLGGVGSWAVEAFARTGIGHLTLIDADDLCLSNTNRQLPAIAGQYGRNKAAAMAERCLAINPAIDVEAVPAFLTPSNLESLLDRDFSLVLDACDSFREDFDGHVATELRVASPIDLAHPALADKGGDLIRAEASTRGQGHGERLRLSPMCYASRPKRCDPLATQSRPPLLARHRGRVMYGARG